MTDHKHTRAVAALNGKALADFSAHREFMAGGPLIKALL